MERIPYKLTKMRYHSFVVYFAMLKRLGWVEPTGVEEPSETQEKMALEPGERPREAGHPRIYYRLTAKGKRAPDHQWSDPMFPLSEYPRAKRSAKRRLVYYVPPRRRARARRPAR